MRKSITILGKNSGLPLTGYTVCLYAWSSGSSGYTGTALYTFTDNSDGTYHADITTTIKATVVVTASGSTSVIVPDNYIGALFEGNNQPTLTPGRTS